MASAAEDLPAGCRVLVTRPAEQAEGLLEAIERAGGVALVHPLIRLEPPASWLPLDEALRRGGHAWSIFTSAPAVRRTFARIREAGLPAPAGGWAAVGPETARALDEVGGRPPEIVPADQRQEGLLLALAGVPSGRMLLPQAAGGRELLRDELPKHGHVVDAVPVYRTVPEENPGALPPFDAATFASPSAIRAFLDRHGDRTLAAAAVAVIGPTTRDAAQSLGIRVDAVAEHPSADALVRALGAYLRGAR